ncbi:hypothetical protein FA13DRAFT_1803470 [Coprinellus micaceus]|uniref:Uncharacterized protein n=1 Tax=Coprinellus micaceus TaxID=71717 RepID=A0A4Y7SB90_COPMI|nr:hypothetical protein FA13DRAFT_1803470 [Coprinellus micaceus]
MLKSGDVLANSWLQNPNIDLSQIPPVAVNEGANRLLPLPPHPSSSSTTSNTHPKQRMADTANPLQPPMPTQPAPPPTQTLPAREIFHETQAAIRPLVNAVRTQEELDDLLDTIQHVRAQQEALRNEDTLHDPPTLNPKGRPRTQRLTGPTEGPPRGGGGLAMGLRLGLGLRLRSTTTYIDLNLNPNPLSDGGSSRKHTSSEGK